MNDLEIVFDQTAEFEKDLKKYTRKYRSLPEDLDNFKYALRVAHFTDGLVCQDLGMFPISGNSLPEGYFVAKKFARKSLKGAGCRSGFRVVYQLNKRRLRLCFIELYHKKEKNTEDFTRLRQYLDES